MPTTYYDTVNGEIIAEYTSGVQLDYLKDALGSVTAWVDQSCTIVASARYKPYGDILVSSGSLGRFTWVGTLGYRTTGLSVPNYYVRARHYAAQQGMWNTVDLLWPRERSYGYGQENSTSATDPTGLWPWDPCGLKSYISPFCSPGLVVDCVLTCARRGQRPLGCLKFPFSCRYDCLCLETFPTPAPVPSIKTLSALSPNSCRAMRL